MSENRLDAEMISRGLCKSRERARQMIKNGKVSVDGKLCEKPAFKVNEKTEIKLNGDIHDYVGRGGLKLERAVSLFNPLIEGKVCLDIGASTGGFTECMLRNGAVKVYALDVGHSQLDPSLRDDDRVVNMEKTNIRDTSKINFDSPINFIATDVSFISLKLVLPKIKELLAENGQAVVLIKPQFEAGKQNISKTGIVRDIKVHRQVLSDITVFAENTGFEIAGLCVSPVKGGSGNIEYLMYLKHISDENNKKIYDIFALVEEAFKKE